MRVRSGVAALLSLALAWLTAAAVCADDGRKPNVVIFLTDDQGTLDVGCYGSDDLYTPAIDDLAANGVRFTQAYAHTVCCPTRALLLTGRHPQRGAVNNWTQGNAKAPAGKGRNMHLEEVTLSEALKASGYKTALFGKWHLGAHVDHGPTKQGFDDYFGHRGGFIDNRNHHFLHGKGFHDLYEGTTEVFENGNYFPDMMTSRAVDYIDQHKESPFFMYVAFNIPHYPEQSDPRFDERYEALAEPRRSYAKMISTTDDRIGSILKRLEKHGIRDNTIVLFMSDNGHSAEDYAITVDNHTSGIPKGANYGANGGGGNTGKWRGRKGTFYEGGIRIPAILSWPKGLPKGAVRKQAIIGADWFPTLLDLCQVPAPKVKLDGKSLVPLLKSASAPSPHKIMHWQWQRSWAVRDGDWKLIGKRDKPSHLGNLSDAEPEMKNYLTDQPAIVEHLLDLHNKWIADVEDDYRQQYPNRIPMY